MNSRGFLAAMLAAAVMAPAASLAQEQAVVPAPAYPSAVAYPMSSEANRAAALTYRQLYRHHKREYRRQRHLERHLGAAVVVAAVVPVPVVAVGVPVAPYVYAPAPVVVPQAVYPAAPPAPVAQAVAAPDTSRVIVGASAQAHPDGAVVGAALFAEGKRLGLHFGASGILARRDERDARLETLKLVEAHLTWAPISGQRGRARIEAGASAAFAPGRNSVGPDVGLSGDLRLLGPIGVEAAARYAPLPHKRIETSAGAFLGLGPLRVSGGWRSLWLDARVLEETESVDCLHGPYLGASLVF